MFVNSKVRKSLLVDGVRFGDVIISGGIYRVLDTAGAYYRLEGLGWFLKDGFEELKQ